MNTYLRLFVIGAIASLSMLAFGVGELPKCGKTVLGPSSLTFAEASGQGLGNYGYVRLTGTRAAIDRTVIVVKTRKNQPIARRWQAGSSAS